MKSFADFARIALTNRTLKNDVAFTLGEHFIILVEHQSTFSENLPLRDLLYISTLFKRMIDTKRLYRKKALMIPRPQFIVLYNGTTDIPEYQELRLSDLYLGEPSKGEEDALQLVAKVYNINCTEFFNKYGTELIEMLFKELTREEDLEISRLDGYDAGEKAGFSRGEKTGFTKSEQVGFSKGEQVGFTKGEQAGFTKGEKSGEQKAALEIARSMKKEKIAADMIAKITGLSMAEINAL